MIRIRFHGRGGQGIKTASRIVGTAAFESGFFTQDSPVYGAERRGAALAAFTRIGAEPILERGVISWPDVIIVGDETLLGDPAAGVLEGLEAAAGVFVNCNPAVTDLAARGLRPPVVACDVTSITLRERGRASALSAGLGAAAARLIGIIGEEELLAATREELTHVGASPETIEQDVRIAQVVFQSLSPLLDRDFLTRASPPLHTADTIWPLAAQGPVRATPSILAAGNAEQRHTGSWRVERPEIHYDRCTRCGICFVRCPDGAISLDERGYPVIDYDHCKGCLMCWQECPVEGAMTKQREVHAW